MFRKAVTFLLETTPSSSRVHARPRTAHVTPHGRGPGPLRRRVPSASASARLRRPRGPAGRLVGGPVVKCRGAPRRMRRGVPVPGVFRERGLLTAGLEARPGGRRPQAGRAPGADGRPLPGAGGSHCVALSGPRVRGCPVVRLPWRPRVQKLISVLWISPRRCHHVRF